MAAIDLSYLGPRLRLHRLHHGVSARAVARTMGRRPSRISAIENAVVVSPRVAEAYIAAVGAVVVARERLTLDDIAAGGVGDLDRAPS